MQLQANIVVKTIRTKRGISLVAFSYMLEISSAYLSLLENGKREMQPQIIGKILNVIADLSDSEKQNLLEIKKEIEVPQWQRAQKDIMKLIYEFFCEIKNGSSKYKLKTLGEKIMRLIEQLIPEYRTEEMKAFA